MDLSERHDSRGARHPWETARLLAVEKLVRQLGLRDPRVLDVGCGDGYVISELQRRLGLGQVVAQDAHFTDEHLREFARPGATFARELGDIPFRADLVLLLDVLEHLEDPGALLRELIEKRVVAGGHFLITVPAFPALFTQHDVLLRHFRRYTRRDLEREVRDAGLELMGSGHLFASLLAPRALSALKERLRPPSGPLPAAPEGVGKWQSSPLATRLIHGALVFDNELCTRARSFGIDIPGLSVWATCRTRS